METTDLLEATQYIYICVHAVGNRQGLLGLQRRPKKNSKPKNMNIK